MLRILDKIIKKTKFNFEYIDLGGGMGINYNGEGKTLNLNKYSNNIKKFLNEEFVSFLEDGNNVEVNFRSGLSKSYDALIICSGTGLKSFYNDLNVSYGSVSYTHLTLPTICSV